MAERDYGALLEQLEADVAPSATPTAGAAPTETGKPWYSKVADFVTGTPEEEKLAAQGIRTEGAPMGVRAAGGMPTDNNSRSIAVMQALGDQAEFKLDKETRRLLYKMPGEESYNTIDPPGLDFGDVAEIMGDVPAMAGETLGYLLSKRFKGGGKIWNAMKRGMGLGGGAAVGEMGRETINIESGAYDNYPQENLVFDKFVKEPAKAAGLSIGGAAGARTLGGMYKTVSNYAKGIAMPEIFRNVGINLPEVTPEAVKEINRFLKQNGIEMEFAPDTARILNDPQFMSALDLYAKNAGLDGHKAVRDLYESNRSALEAALEAAEAQLELPGGVTAYEAGNAAQRAAEGGVNRAERAMEQRVGQAATDADTAQAALSAEARNTTDEAFGEQIRDVAEAENAALKNWAETNYGAIAKEAGNMRFYHNNLMKEAQNQSALFNMDISKQLTAENRTLVTDIVENLQAMRTTPTGGTYMAPLTSSFDQQQRLISQLKRAEREIDRGTLTGIEKSSLTKLRLAAMKDRTERLVQFDNANNTKLSERLQATDAQYRDMKDKVARGTLGKLLTYVDGRPRVANSRVFDNIFGTDRMNAASTREVMDVLTGDIKYLPELNEMRRGVMDSFLRANVDTKGKINPDRAKKWLADRKANLEAVLTPTQLNELRSAASKADVLKIGQQRQKEFLKALNKSIPGRVASMDPSTVFKSLWKSPESIEEARKLLQKSYPQEWDQFMGSAVSRVRNDIMRYEPLVERKTVNFGRLNSMLDDSDYVQKLETFLLLS